MEKELKINLKSLLFSLFAIVIAIGLGLCGYFYGLQKGKNSTTVALNNKKNTYEQLNKKLIGVNNEISSKQSELNEINKNIKSEKSDEQTLQNHIDDLNNKLDSAISSSQSTDSSQSVSVTKPTSGHLDSGTYLVGTDIGAARYQVIADNPCSILISKDNTYVNSYILGNGSNSATFTLTNGETVQFNNSVSIKPIN